MAARLLPLGAVIAVDRVPERLELAKDLGATHTIDATGLRPEDVIRSLFEATDGRGVDNAVETTAVPSVLRTAVDALAPRGACAVVGAPPAGTEVALDVQGLLTGKRVIGVTLGDADPETLIPHMVALHRAGKLPLERLIRHYGLDEIGLAAADMHEGRTIKPVIRLS
jgi:aryl-alcohol dehydrogenase